MLYKARTKSIELQVFEILNKRMDLMEHEKLHYYNLKKGYEGEVMFDQITGQLQCDCLILNDLLLKLNNTTFQIDSLILIMDKIHFFEVKNYEGDYYYESDRIYNMFKREISNPLTQLSRNESLLRQLLQSIGLHFTIDASVVFINPEFTLYQSPLYKPFLFPTQIKRYFEKLDKTSAKLNKRHHFLAEKLLSLHLNESPFTQIPKYHYHLLRKGITCVVCDSFALNLSGYHFVCENCGKAESISDAVIRSVNEFHILFPNEKITTSVIHDWCQIIPSKKRIFRILEKKYKKISRHRWSYFE